MSSSPKNRKKILVIVSRFPYPLEKGDKLRAFYQLQELSKDYSLTLCALSDSPVSDKQLEVVSAYCKEVHVFRISKLSRGLQLFLGMFSKKPYQVAYFHNYSAQRSISKLIKNSDYHHIYCQLLRTTEYVKNVHHIPKTLDYMDALSAGIQRRIGKQPWYKKWLFRSEYKRLVSYERSIFDYFENKTIISEQDRSLIIHPENKEILIVPNGIHQDFFNAPRTEKDHDIVFVGNMSYAPNVTAVQFFRDHIIPQFPKSKILISGSSPDSKVTAIANKYSQITLTGWVDDIRISYVRGKVFVAPMFIGTGMQNKLLEAMALGIPCITTPLANNAIKAESGKQILVGETPEELINHIKFCLNNPEDAAIIGSAGAQFVRQEYSWEKSVNTLRTLFR